MYILKDRVFNVKWRSDFDKACVVVNFERRGWQKWKEVSSLVLLLQKSPTQRPTRNHSFSLSLSLSLSLFLFPSLTPVFFFVC